MTEPKISCLMATAGRHGLTQASLAMFLMQDWPDKELVILNNSETALFLDSPLPNVRVYNEPGYATLGHVRQRLLELATGELIRSWDNDDIFFAWSLRQGADRIGNAPAWKHKRSFWYNGQNGRFALDANAFEASVTWRSHFVRQFGYRLGQGNEHELLMQALGNAGPASEEMELWSGYCYVFGNGAWHASGTIGDGRPEETRAAEWLANNRDVRPGVPLTPDYAAVHRWLRALARQIPPPLQTAWLSAAMGVGAAHVKPLSSATKLMTHDAAANLCRNRRVVVASGCFDLLHAGHEHTLKWAREQGDALVVLLNDDRGVAEQKGDGRPLVPFDGRLAALSALACVDGVCVVYGADDRSVLEKLRPAFLAKGGEYASRAVRNSDLAEVIVAPPCQFALHTTDLVHAAA